METSCSPSNVPGINHTLYCFHICVPHFIMLTQHTKYWLALLATIVSPLTAALQGTAGKEESESLATASMGGEMQGANKCRRDAAL